MQMVGQDYPCIDMKRPFRADRFDCFAQKADMGYEQIAVALEQIDGEKIRAALNAVTAIAGHEIIIM